MKRLTTILIILSWGVLFLLSPYYVSYVSRGLKKIQRILGVTDSIPVNRQPVLDTPRFIPRKKIETATWYNGITVNSKLETQAGKNASQERVDVESYKLDLTLNLKTPSASRDLTELNPKLATQWPELAALISNATVSAFYEGLYQRKLDWLNARLVRLDQLLSRHNFYDCDTVLEITAPVTRRKALFIQSEMDVVSDGSDPDRQIILPTNTANYQPFTSYRWRKQSTNESVFIEIRKNKLTAYKTELTVTNLTVQRRQVVLNTMDQLKREIYDLESYSYLVASEDPFIVLPGFMFRDPRLSHAPRIGDYAVVIYEDQFYPAIVGDIGPSYKMGEASLRLAQAINPASTPYQRPVSDLRISYLVFINSADSTPSSPNIQRWHEKCAILLNELGGFSDQLHKWVSSNTITNQITP